MSEAMALDDSIAQARKVGSIPKFRAALREALSSISVAISTALSHPGMFMNVIKRSPRLVATSSSSPKSDSKMTASSIIVGPSVMASLSVSFSSFKRASSNHFLAMGRRSTALVALLHLERCE